MSQNQQTEFDIHNPQSVMSTFAQIKQVLRQVEDAITILQADTEKQLLKERRAALEQQRVEAAKITETKS